MRHSSRSTVACREIKLGWAVLQCCKSYTRIHWFGGERAKVEKVYSLNGRISGQKAAIFLRFLCEIIVIWITFTKYGTGMFFMNRAPPPVIISPCNLSSCNLFPLLSFSL